MATAKPAVLEIGAEKQVVNILTTNQIQGKKTPVMVFSDSIIQFENPKYVADYGISAQATVPDDAAENAAVPVTVMFGPHCEEFTMGVRLPTDVVVNGIYPTTVSQGSRSTFTVLGNHFPAKGFSVVSQHPGLMVQNAKWVNSTAITCEAQVEKYMEPGSYTISMFLPRGWRQDITIDVLGALNPDTVEITPDTFSMLEKTSFTIQGCFFKDKETALEAPKGIEIVWTRQNDRLITGGLLVTDQFHMEGETEVQTTLRIVLPYQDPIDIPITVRDEYVNSRSFRANLARKDKRRNLS